MGRLKGSTIARAENIQAALLARRGSQGTVRHNAGEGSSPSHAVNGDIQTFSRPQPATNNDVNGWMDPDIVFNQKKLNIFAKTLSDGLENWWDTTGPSKRGNRQRIHSKVPERTFFRHKKQLEDLKKKNKEGGQPEFSEFLALKRARGNSPQKSRKQHITNVSTVIDLTTEPHNPHISNSSAQEDEVVIHPTPRAIHVEDDEVLIDPRLGKSALCMRRAVRGEDDEVLIDPALRKSARFARRAIRGEDDEVLIDSASTKSAPCARRAIHDEDDEVLIDSVSIKSAPCARRAVRGEDDEVLIDLVSMKSVPCARRAVRGEDDEVLIDSVSMKSAPRAQKPVRVEDDEVLIDPSLTKSTPCVRRTVRVEDDEVLIDLSLRKDAPRARRAVRVEDDEVLIDPNLRESTPCVRRTDRVEDDEVLIDLSLREDAPRVRRTVRVEDDEVLIDPSLRKDMDDDDDGLGGTVNNAWRELAEAANYDEDKEDEEDIVEAWQDVEKLDDVIEEPDPYMEEEVSWYGESVMDRLLEAYLRNTEERNSNDTPGTSTSLANPKQPEPILDPNHPPKKDDLRLKKALEQLKQILKDEHLEPRLHQRVRSMVGFLRIFIEDRHGWSEASLLVAKAAGHGKAQARQICKWTRSFITSGTLPINLYRRFQRSLIHDEDFATIIQNEIRALKKEFIEAEDVLNILKKDSIQDQFGCRTDFSLRTARRWLQAMDYRYREEKKGMYVDGHEREDTVKYRQEIFLPQWKEYRSKMRDLCECEDSEHSRDCDVVSKSPPHRLVLVTHDESTFYANDRRKKRWVHEGDPNRPQAKGDGASIMASVFLTAEDGNLQSKDGTRNSRIMFKAGKNRDGYFNHDRFMAQVKDAIDIFEEHYGPNVRALFAFDNATIHQKRATNALSARKMPKGAGWSSKLAPERMRCGILPNGDAQDFYEPNTDPTSNQPGTFKGMAKILVERGFTNAPNLLAQCLDFKCADESLEARCCCRRILYNQPDFRSQEPEIVEYIKQRGHFVIYYPKFHCELNFIEQYWGAAKQRYRLLPRTSSLKQMEKNVEMCLDGVPLKSIRRFCNRSQKFISAYARGLTGTQAAWANKKAKGHRTISEQIFAAMPPDLA